MDSAAFGHSFEYLEPKGGVKTEMAVKYKGQVVGGISYPEFVLFKLKVFNSEYNTAYYFGARNEKFPYSTTDIYRFDPAKGVLVKIAENTGVPADVSPDEKRMAAIEYDCADSEPRSARNKECGKKIVLMDIKLDGIEQGGTDAGNRTEIKGFDPIIQNI